MNPAISIVDFYRKHLSRTLFKDIECSFPQNTCSLYAKNQFQKHSFLNALKATKERLKRCKHYAAASIEDTLFVNKGISDIAKHPSQAVKHIEYLKHHCESDHVMGHVLQSAQLAYEQTHHQKSPELEALIEQENLTYIAPRINQIDNPQRALYTRAAVQSLITLPLLTATLIPEIPSSLIYLSMGSFMLHYFLNARKKLTRIRSTLSVLSS